MVALKISASAPTEFKIQVNGSPSNNTATTESGIPSTQTSTQRGTRDTLRDITYSSLFGSDNTASQYSVSGNTLTLENDSSDVLARLELRKGSNGQQNAISVRADGAAGLLLYSDRNMDPATTTPEWIQQARLVSRSYTTSSSSGSVGAGSSLTFGLTQSRSLITSLTFAQSSTDPISGMRSGRLVGNEAWTESGVLGSLPIIMDSPDLALVISNAAGGFPALVSIQYRNNGEQLLVTYHAARSTSAQDVTVTYNRPDP